MTWASAMVKSVWPLQSMMVNGISIRSLNWWTSACACADAAKPKSAMLKTRIGRIRAIRFIDLSCQIVCGKLLKREHTADAASLPTTSAYNAATMRRTVILLIACLFASPAFGWGEKGHYIVNEAATYALPTDMPPFFYKAFPELIFLAYDPD